MTTSTKASKLGTKQVFPRELLAESTMARLAYFEGKILHHKILDDKLAELIHAIRYPGASRTVNIYGPTGVGKTTLRLLVEQRFEEEMLKLEQYDGYGPIIGVDAIASEGSSFSWKDFYTRLVFILDEQCKGDKIELRIQGIRRDAMGCLVIDRAVVVPALRRVAVELIKHVRPVAIMVDEAPHIIKLASGSRTSDQMDVLKSLSDEVREAGTVFVLLGTYAMLDLANLNGQQGRRSIDIHFRRYMLDSDRDEFNKLLRTMQRHLPLNEEPKLGRLSDYLYTGCVGCVGVLKSWLYRTLAAVLEGGKLTLTRVDLEKYAVEKGKLLQMARDIWEGEKELKRLEGECDRMLGQYLGIGPKGSQDKP